MYSRKLYIYFLGVILSILYLMDRTNDYFANPKIYNAPLFYNDMSLGILGTFIILLISLLAFGYVVLSKIDHSQNNLILSTVTIIIFSFLFKAMLYNFDFDFGNRADLILKRHYYGNEFVVYKAYAFIVGLFSIIFEEYNNALAVLNVILGSITLGIWYLQFKKMTESNVIPLITIILILFYIPLTAAETLIRVDVLYIFMLSLSILFLTNLYNEYSIKNIILLSITLLILCFVREQTIYFLPLYIGLLILKKDKTGLKTSIIIPTAIVIITSFSISNYNSIHYGFSSLFKERILIQKIMQYGYLTEENVISLNTKLSQPAIKLLDDINSVYQDNLLPSRREINQYATNDFLKLIRPNHQTIFQKTNLMSFVPDDEIESAKDYVRNLLLKSNNNFFNVSDIDYIFTNDNLKPNNLNYRIIKDIKYVIINDFFYDNARYFDSFVLSDLKTSNNYCFENLDTNYSKRIWNIKPSNELMTQYESQIYAKACLSSVIDKINRIYLVSLRSNDYYHVAAQKIAPSFHPDTQSYIYNSNINHVTEIASRMPIQYFVQSIVVMLSQTGYVPVPSGMSNRIYQVYNDPFIGKDLFMASQKLYYIIVNFWYLVSLLVLIIYCFFLKEEKSRNINLFLSVFALYYGLFISFASYGEFPRLILPIIPILIYNFVVVTSFFYRGIIRL